MTPSRSLLLKSQSETQSERCNNVSHWVYWYPRGFEPTTRHTLDRVLTMTSSNHQMKGRLLLTGDQYFPSVYEANNTPRLVPPVAAACPYGCAKSIKGTLNKGALANKAHLAVCRRSGEERIVYPDSTEIRETCTRCSQLRCNAGADPREHLCRTIA